MIMIIAFVFRNMPVGIRAGLANLSQIDRSLDEASLTLGARSATTLRRVILPILRPAVATSMVYAFVRAITSVSAVIFLVSGEFNLATVYIVGRAEFGEYGLAIVYSAVLIVIMVAGADGDPGRWSANGGSAAVRGRRDPQPSVRGAGVTSNLIEPATAARAATGRPAVEFRAVSKRYGPVTAVDARRLHDRARHAGDPARARPAAARPRRCA